MRIRSYSFVHSASPYLLPSPHHPSPSSSASLLLVGLQQSLIFPMITESVQATGRAGARRHRCGHQPPARYREQRTGLACKCKRKCVAEKKLEVRGESLCARCVPLGFFRYFSLSHPRRWAGLHRGFAHWVSRCPWLVWGLHARAQYVPA
ncbi:hypothetical protein B0H13DRAFT_2048772 [Mycena leptocephala]|nr:hypothetical protein B0H13DRAFT_2048772 [Mycena leptocephala]